VTLAVGDDIVTAEVAVEKGAIPAWLIGVHESLSLDRGQRGCPPTYVIEIDGGPRGQAGRDQCRQGICGQRGVNGGEERAELTRPRLADGLIIHGAPVVLETRSSRQSRAHADPVAVNNGGRHRDRQAAGESPQHQALDGEPGRRFGREGYPGDVRGHLHPDAGAADLRANDRGIDAGATGDVDGAGNGCF
jgi:hypothetical protein